MNTVIIGGGQAGLSLSYFLTGHNHEHTILEKHRTAESWRSRRWDSFCLVTPNWQLQLPDFPYQGADPDGFLTRDQVVQYIDDFAAGFNPPLRLGVEATSIDNNGKDDGFIVSTSAGPIHADNIVVATGTFQKPRLPGFSRNISPDIVQIHSGLYRNPASLPDGAVLVVGSGQSGCQISRELNESGKKVYLSTGTAGRVPRRYRGKDFTWWLNEMGVIDNTADTLPSPAARFKANPQVSGAEGGQTMNLHQFALDGVTLLGHLKGADGSRIELKDDLKENLKMSDSFATEFKKGVDQFIEKSGTEAPPEDETELSAGYDADVLTGLDLKSAGITSIIWANGYSFDFSWIHFPIFDEFGYPEQTRGVTEIPGLYFLGLHWMHTIKSGLFLGIAEDARHIADHIDRRNQNT